MKKETIRIERSKTRIPVLWEKGGGSTSGGSSLIIASSKGEEKVAIYIPKGGHLCNGQHALIPIQEGDIIIKDNQSHGDHITSIFKILKIEEETAIIEKINEFSRGEWDNKLDEKLVRAVNAAQMKSESYHCREVFFAKSR